MKVVTTYTIDKTISSVYVSGWGNSVNVNVNFEDGQFNCELTLKQAEALAQDLQIRVKRLKEAIAEEMKEKENADI